ncbi:hypothetical protein G6705_02595 [Polynucleobacter paneuropaeus]|nr:hypothetical protein [Polynucleobacter paneuropaeus]
MSIYKQKDGFRFGKIAIFFIEWVWLFAITSFTVIKYSPTGLHADILINSLMSLRNVTLFYWGQNRLINILPFLALPFRDPALNLAIILFISSLSIFLLLLVISKVSSRFIGNPAGSPHQTIIFLLISSLFVLILNGSGIAVIAIGHIEYSMPFLFALLAVYLIWFGPFVKRANYFLSVVLVFLSMGLNPSTLVVLMFLCFARILYNRKFQAQDLLISISASTSFIAWAVISRIYGDVPYGKYVINKVVPGILSASSGLAGLIDIPFSLFLMAAFTAYKCYEIASFKARNDSPVIAYTFYAIGFTSFFWIIFFSGNYWVVANDFNVRYFIYLIFGMFIAMGVELGGILKTLKKGVIAIIVLTFVCFASVASYATLIPYSKFSIFEEVNQLSPNSYDFYAGDYWVVWPSVLRDQMQGKISHAFTDRAEANKESALRSANSHFQNTGFITVLCLKRKSEECIKQTKDIVGAVELEAAEVINNKVTALKIIKKAKD